MTMVQKQQGVSLLSSIFGQLFQQSLVSSVDKEEGSSRNRSLLVREGNENSRLRETDDETADLKKTFKAFPKHMDVNEYSRFT